MVTNCKDFSCDNGSRCLPSSYLCDGIQHCADASDEVGENVCKTPTLYKCLIDQPPIYVPWTYTFYRHLFRYCNDSSEQHTRQMFGFRCEVSEMYKLTTDTKVLVPMFYLLNNISICDDHSDVCYDSRGNFMCSRCLDNKTIINSNFNCDGLFDCPDLSDECLCDSSTEEMKNVCEMRDELDLSTFCNQVVDSEFDEKFCRLNQYYTCVSFENFITVTSIKNLQKINLCQKCEINFLFKISKKSNINIKIT